MGAQVTHRLTDAYPDLAGASNVLLLGPAMDPAMTSACTDLLTMFPLSETNVLHVALTDSAATCLDRWRDQPDDTSPGEIGIVTANDQTRSVASDPSQRINQSGSVSINSISDPRNLTDLGVRISEHLSAWQTPENDNHTVMDFDSLTALLQYSDQDRVFQFLHVLKGRINKINCLAHYHMDPTAHDIQTTNTFKSLMDAIIEINDDGEWVVTSQ